MKTNGRSERIRTSDPLVPNERGSSLSSETSTVNAHIGAFGRCLFLPTCTQLVRGRPA